MKGYKTSGASGGGGGHTILNQAGTAMDQRHQMQFVDATLTDDSVNDITKVEVIKSVTSAQLATAPDGIYRTTDEGDAPISAGDIAYTSGGASTVKAVLDSAVGINIFEVDSTDWDSNDDPDTMDQFPYIAEISTTIYSDDSKPIWQLRGVNGIPTEEELTSINMVLYGMFLSTGITLYATDQPTEDLILEVGGAATSYASADASGVAYDNTESGLAATTLQGAIDELSDFNTFSIATTDWVANQDSTTSTDYPYVAVKSSTLYRASSTPEWDLVGVGNIPTAAEAEAAALVPYAYFNTTGVTLYAKDEPGEALVLRVWGR